MDSKVFCVYNLARGVYLSSKVSIAEDAHHPLKILNLMVSGFALQGDSGLWLRPLSGRPAVPRLFPFDLVYLDKDHRILNAVEMLPGVEFPPYEEEVSSGLVLPLHTMQNTHTGQGDRLIICREEEMERLLGAIEVGTGIREEARGPVPIDRPKRTAATGPVAPTAAFSWIRFSNETAAEGMVPSEERQVSEPKQPQTRMKTGEKKAGNGGQGSKFAAEPVENAAEMKWKASGSMPIEQEKAAQSPEKAQDARRIEKPKIKAEKNPVPKISITEVVIEGPKPKAPEVGDGADLFANWVDSPSVAPDWIEKKQDPFIQRVEQVLRRESSKTPAGAEEGSTKISAATPENVGMPAEGAAHTEAGVARMPAEQQASIGGGSAKDVRASESAAQETKRTSADAPPMGPEQATSKTVADPRQGIGQGIAIGSGSQAASFTVAQYGMWPAALSSSASAPADSRETKIRSSSTAQPTAAHRPTVPHPSEETSNAPAPVGKDTAHERQHRASSPEEAQENGSGTAPAVQMQEREAPRSGAPNGDADPVATRPIQKVGTSETRVVNAKTANQQVAMRQSAPQSTERAQAGDAARTAAGRPATKATAVEPSAPEQSAHGAGERTDIGVFTKLPRILKVDAAGPGLATRLRRWLNPIARPSERRRAERRYVPGMVAHYYNGGAPKPHAISDISMTGFYVLTEDRWMPETMIQMTLQKPCAKGERRQSITVLSRIVRRGSDGIAAEFVTPESLDPYGHEIHPTQTTDKVALARFL